MLFQYPHEYLSKCATGAAADMNVYEDSVDGSLLEIIIENHGVRSFVLMTSSSHLQLMGFRCFEIRVMKNGYLLY